MLQLEDATKIKVQFSGGKLLKLHIKGEVNEICFKDSNLLLGMPLKSFKKNLSLEGDYEKEI